MAEDAALQTLTEQMKGWQAGAENVDLNISPEGRKAYVDAVDRLREALVKAQSNLSQLKSMKHPGNYDSALDTRSGLIGDAQTLDETLTDYIAYLDAYKQTVIDASNRMMQSG